MPRKLHVRQRVYSVGKNQNCRSCSSPTLQGMFMGAKKKLVVMLLTSIPSICASTHGTALRVSQLDIFM